MARKPAPRAGGAKRGNAQNPRSGGAKRARAGGQRELFGAPAKPAKFAKSAKSAKSPAAKAVKSKSAAAKKPAAGKKKNPAQYTAADIEVLEGLEPVRRRPGMYIGGTDEHALHHLAAELLDNAMDEAVAGHAGRISLDLDASGAVTVTDNGRGIPADPHPKFKNKTALEVILTTLHSGGKFNTGGGGVYETSGGLHGVGLSVVNALSESLRVEVARGGDVRAQDYRRGKPRGPLKKTGAGRGRRGTKITFRPDPEIFGAQARFRPARLHRMARSKAYLFRGVEIRWSCAKSLLRGEDAPPPAETFKFPGGLADFLSHELAGRALLTHAPFAGASKMNGAGRVEWAAAWPEDDGGGGFFSSYCNTVPTPGGGAHEAGFRAAVLRGLKTHAERVNFKAAQKITAEDAAGPACVMLSVFLRDPQFQGQTKERLASAGAQRLVENAVRDHFEHWLSADAEGARALLEAAAERAEGRLRRRHEKNVKRQSASRRLRLPGKLADCTRSAAQGTELFIVEGDSAGGSAKQARRRETQAVLPLRGKILNVASAGAEKLRANKELSDLAEALGCGTGAAFDVSKLRYEKIIIMTDADVDGAHIASLLMTFFFLETPALVEAGKLFLAQPPLYRLTQGGRSVYALDAAARARIEKNVLTGRGKIEVSRFKGLGEMPAEQLRVTAMAPETRRLLRVTLPKGAADKTVSRLVESLMGKRPERRFAYIQERAKFVSDIDV